MSSHHKVGRPRHSTGQAGVISAKEIKQIHRSIDLGDPDLIARNHLVVALSYYVGLRAKEIAALQISDLYDGSSVNKVLRLTSDKVKGDKHRDLYISNSKLRTYIQDYINYRLQVDGELRLSAPLIRSRQGSKFSPASMSRMIGLIYKAAGFQSMTSHSGRRSMITDLANKGVDLNSIRVIAGHSSIATTQRYIEHNPQVISDILKSR